MNKDIGKLNKKDLAWIRDGDCIRCTSHALNYGYPRIYFKGQTRKIARLILVRRLGYIPPTVVSRHTCDNRWCIRPDHIISGTIADNNRDQQERGNYHGQFGEDSHLSKLTSLQVLQIRESTGLQRQIAKQFGISRQQVSKIKNRQRWSHI